LVPAAGSEAVTIAMREVGEGLVEVDPWPFAPAELGLEAAGRRLPGSFSDREQLRAALARAGVETLSVKLVRPQR
jgi:hypothetical protein